MKKFLIILCVFFLIGCARLSNTPTKRVEDFLSNYQNLDKNVISQLDKVVENEESFNNSQREMYKDIMKEHYKGLTYEIKDEEINGDKAVVKVEIEVVDYSKVLDQALLYFQSHQNEFKDETGEYNVKFVDYKLNKMKESKDKVKYTLEINLTLNNKDWKVNDLSSSDFDKINGTYKY